MRRKNAGHKTRRLACIELAKKVNLFYPKTGSKVQKFSKIKIFNFLEPLPGFFRLWRTRSSRRTQPGETIIADNQNFTTHLRLLFLNTKKIWVKPNLNIFLTTWFDLNRTWFQGLNFIFFSHKTHFDLHDKFKIIRWFCEKNRTI